jgi:hypothetical protein
MLDNPAKSGQPFNDSKHKVPPRDTLTASSDILVAGILAHQVESLCLAVGVTDQFGEEHQVEGIIASAPGPCYNVNFLN